MPKLKNKLVQKSNGRPKPLTAKAGFTVSKRRYGKGGKLCK